MTRNEIDAICDAIYSIGWQDSEHTEDIVRQLRLRLEEEAERRGPE